MPQAQRDKPSFVDLAAMVATRLDAVMKTARQVSLSAANAKAKSERAGATGQQETGARETGPDGGTEKRS